LITASQPQPQRTAEEKKGAKITLKRTKAATKGCNFHSLHSWR